MKLFRRRPKADNAEEDSNVSRAAGDAASKVIAGAAAGKGVAAAGKGIMAAGKGVMNVANAGVNIASSGADAAKGATANAASLAKNGVAGTVALAKDGVGAAKGGVADAAALAKGGVAGAVALAKDGVTGAADKAFKGFAGVAKTLRGGDAGSEGRGGGDDVVVARTPAGCWFTPSAGWPQDVDTWEDGAPPPLMPSAREAPALFAEGATSLQPIGELRIEVLEAEGLRSRDMMTSCDPYAVVLFEGYAARTHPIQGTSRPRWLPERSARAFALPVRLPFSCAYVALLDADVLRRKLNPGKSFINELGSTLGTSSLGSSIGRVVLELSTLTPGTEYDCWLPLHTKSTEAPDGRRRGFVRLRYSLRVKSERSRLLRYVMPPTIQPEFAVPFSKRTHLKHSRFAYSGIEPTNHFSLRVLRAHLVELSDALDECIEAVLFAYTDLLFWRGWRIPESVFACVAWQWLVSYPRFLPACIPLLGCHFLARSYQRSLVLATTRQQKSPSSSSSSAAAAAVTNLKGRTISRAISEQPGLMALAKGLILGSPPAILQVEPASAGGGGEGKASARDEDGGDDEEDDDDDDDEEEEDDDDDEEGEAGAGEGGGDAKGSGGLSGARALKALNPLRRKRAKAASIGRLRLVSRFVPSKGSFAAKLKELKKLVEAEIDEMIEDAEGEAKAEDGGQGKTLAGRMLGGAVDRVKSVNPLAVVLTPVQHGLGKLAAPVRSVERLLLWQDRVTTGWVWVGLLTLSVLLALPVLLLPWLAALLCRLVGLAALGPHMHLVGRWLAKRSAEAQAKEAAWAAADAEGKERLAEVAKAELLAKAKKKLEKAQARLSKRSRTQAARDAYISDNRYNLIVLPSRTSMRVKHRALADVTRSRAYAAPEGW